LTRKSIHEISFSSNQDLKRKVAAYKKRMPIAQCVCGFEILVVPDLKAMKFAINKHLANDRKVRFGSERLAEQVLIVVSKMNLSNLN
jgi:hypothetical protein